MVWLDPDGVARRLRVCRRTAISLMYQMEHSVISGTSRKRIRVSEDALDAWMMRDSEQKIQKASGGCGTKKRIARR